MISLDRYRRKDAHRETIVAACYSPSGKYLVTADRGGTVAVQLREGGQKPRTIRTRDSTLTGAWFSQDEKWLLWGCQGGRLHIHNLPDLGLVDQVQLGPQRSAPENILSGTSRPVLDWVVLTVCPQGDASCYAVLEFRDFFTIRRAGPEVAGHRHVPGALLDCAVASPDGRLIFYGDDLGYIYRSQVPGMELTLFGEHRERVRGLDGAGHPIMMDASPGVAGLALSPDGQWLTSTSQSGGVQIWRTRATAPAGGGRPTIKPVAARPPEQDGWARGVCFVYGSSGVLFGADNGRITFWEYEVDRTAHWAQSPAAIRALDASPNGREIVVGCEDGSVYVVPWGDAPAAAQAGATRGGWLGRIFGRRAG